MKNLKLLNYILLLMLIVLLPGIVAGCNPCNSVPPATGSMSAQVLLNFQPSNGSVMTPTRMRINETSIEGWLAPDKEVLSFPIFIGAGARLSFQIGISGEIERGHGDGVFRVDFKPEGESYSRITVYHNEINLNPDIEWDWIPCDVPIPDTATGEGELEFIAAGSIADNPDIDILWGEPTVYYPENRHHRNVLLIGVDTLRRDAVSAYGESPDVTPNLEEFSHSATIFDQARSQSPWTLPSFSSMVTGRLPSDIGATLFSGYLPDEPDTIGELVRSRGYATATICTNTWLGNEKSGFQQGMDELWFLFDGKADSAVEKTIDYIGRVTDRDWFCFLHIIDPHTSYAPPRRFIEQLRDPTYNGPYRDGFGDLDEWKGMEEAPPEDDLNQVHNLYRGEVAFVDEALGQLFDWLEERNLTDETLIVFASDHGEEFFEHGGFEHGQSVYDELVHIPLMVRGEGFPAERIDTSVGNTDILPAILQYLDIPLPQNLQGIPLQRIIDEGTTEARIIYGEDTSRGPLLKYAVEWPYKCILNYSSGEAVLYDLENDPGETDDVSGEYPDINARLAQSIVNTMVPHRTGFHIWFMASPTEAPKTFTGTIVVQPGIQEVQSFGLEEADRIITEGNAIRFEITNTVPFQGIDKHFIIFPAVNDQERPGLEINVRVNGQIAPNAFFPYGSLVPEPSGHAVVLIDDFPIGAEMPMGNEVLPPAMYIWGIKRITPDESRAFDEETMEQLRSLGYVN